jgi:DNA polymerase-1
VPNESKSPVFLLDTMSFIFRAYHAMQRSRPMSTRSGLPTAAIYVFTNMIRKLRQDFSPEYFAAVFDLGGEVFRDEKAREMGSLRKWNGKTQSFDEVDYAGYKANRAETPEDLKKQIPYIRKVLEALRIPILAAEGFEADDVIGTLAREAEEAGHEVFIVSGDKDMMQLVNGRVKMLNPQKDNLVLDPAKVEEVLGVPPEKVIDVMALRGDAVDNVPGAPGIGDKGSVDLIREFGSVEAVLDHAEEVKRKTYRESLQQNRDAVLLSKELVTIDTHVPVEFDLAAMRTQAQDVDACRALFAELEFTSMLRDLEPAAPKVVVEILDEPTAEQTAEFYAAARAGFAFAVDVTAPVAEDEEAPPPMQSLLDVAEAVEKQTHFVVGVSADPARALRLPLTPELRALFEDASVIKQTHDAKSALHALDAQDARVCGTIDDTQLLSYAINPTHTSPSLVDVAARANHAAPTGLAASAAAVRSLVPALRKQVDETGLTRVYAEIDLPLVPVLFRMEKVGVRVDLHVLDGLSKRIGAEMETASAKIFAAAGRVFNINSPKQLGEVLYKDLGLPAPAARGKSKSLSTAQDILEHLAEQHDVPRMVLDYRHLSKLKSNYTDALPQLVDAQSRVHTTFLEAGTTTGRLSSTSPNLQNIPVRTELGREIRAAFVGSEGTRLLSADYSQIELRLLAHFSGDPLLRRAYSEDIDIHALTASEVFGVPLDTMDKETRRRAKAVNFGIVYGISPFGLAAQLGIAMSEAKSYIDRYFERYHGVREYIDKTIAEVRKEGSVRTYFGRVRPIPDIESRNQNQRGFAERTAVNSPLQGTAADLIKLAMIAIDRELTARRLKTCMVLQVHDELLFEVPLEESDEVAAIVRQEMEHVVELDVPLVASMDFGANWRDLK